MEFNEVLDLEVLGIPSGEIRESGSLDVLDEVLLALEVGLLQLLHHVHELVDERRWKCSQCVELFKLRDLAWNIALPVSGVLDLPKLFQLGGNKMVRRDEISLGSDSFSRSSSACLLEVDILDLSSSGSQLFSFQLLLSNAPEFFPAGSNLPLQIPEGLAGITKCDGREQSVEVEARLLYDSTIKDTAVATLQSTK